MPEQPEFDEAVSFAVLVCCNTVAMTAAIAAVTTTRHLNASQEIHNDTALAD